MERRWQQVHVQCEIGIGKQNRIFVDGHEIRDWYSLNIDKEMDGPTRIQLGFYGEVNLDEQDSIPPTEPEPFFSGRKFDTNADTIRGSDEKHRFTSGRKSK